MKLLMNIILITIISMATESSFIKDIEVEVYKIQDFNKYQDAPAVPKKEFIGIGSIKFLGWSKQNYIAYLVEDSIKSIMGDGVYADLIIYDTINNKVVYTKQIEYLDENSKNHNYPTFNEIYFKYKEKIIKILNQYSIVYKKNIYIKRLPFKTFDNKKLTFFFIKKYFRKNDKYLHQISLYSKINGQINLCKKEILDDKKYLSILDEKVIGILPTLNQKVYVVVIAYVHTNGAEGNSVDMRLLTCNLSENNSIKLKSNKYKSLWDFCKKLGYSEQEIRKLNPWINKKATNISPNAEIIIPNLSKEENNKSK